MFNEDRCCFPLPPTLKIEKKINPEQKKIFYEKALRLLADIIKLQCAKHLLLSSNKKKIHPAKNIIFKLLPRATHLMSDKTDSRCERAKKLLLGEKGKHLFQNTVKKYELSVHPPLMYSYCMHSKRVTFLWTQSGNTKQAAGPLGGMPHRH